MSSLAGNETRVAQTRFFCLQMQHCSMFGTSFLSKIRACTSSANSALTLCSLGTNGDTSAAPPPAFEAPDAEIARRISAFRLLKARGEAIVAAISSTHSSHGWRGVSCSRRPKWETSCNTQKSGRRNWATKPAVPDQQSSIACDQTPVVSIPHDFHQKLCAFTSGRLKRPSSISPPHITACVVATTRF